LRRNASEYLRRNPYRLHLGKIGFQFSGIEKSESELMNRITNPEQVLDLWTGTLRSTFRYNDTVVKVLTVCHPHSDIISSSVTSPLIRSRSLRVNLSFSTGADSQSGFGFNFPLEHKTEKVSGTSDELVLRRITGDSSYYIVISAVRSGIIQVDDENWLITPDGSSGTMEFSFHFSKEQPADSELSFRHTSLASEKAWESYWLSGGAVDFSGSSDPRAFELERRVVLSQYLTRVQSAGSLPPAETGLTYNSWYGKFHLEMHWWHAAHFALWNRNELLEKQLEYYNTIYDKASATALMQGYSGVRWPKMTDPEGNESPSGVGPYLIWQQPHIIYFAEQLYQSAADKNAVLNKYWNLVSSTADFMASYAWYDSTRSCYSLGPLLISAQETLKPETTVNPTFELVYWYWGLKTAEEWRKRLGYKIEPGWDIVANNLAPLPQKNGIYLTSDDNQDTWSNPRMMSDHPIIAGIMGMIPETGLADKTVLGATLDTIQKRWNWKSCWGWDYPLLAMSAAAIDRPEQAVDFLLMDAPKNKYLPNGHNYQDTRLTIYLPGNGGLLSAVAMMCTAGDFPSNGWKVKWEGLNPPPGGF
jgi:hypothetical protein